MHHRHRVGRLNPVVRRAAQAALCDRLESRVLLAGQSFGAPTFYGQDSSLGVAVADMNGDGKLDVLAPESGSGGSTVDVYLNTGNGTLAAPTQVSASNANVSVDQPYAVAVGDLNHDTKMDIAVASFSGQLSVMLGDGSGTHFSPANVYSAGAEPDGIAIGDVNGDSIPDIVVANRGSNSVSVFLGNGDGTFQSQVTFSTGSGPNSVALADLNSDNRLDIVTANSGDSTVSVLLNTGGGNFGPADNISVPGGPISAVVADFNGDQKLDIATADNTGNTVSVLLGNGSGSFAAPMTTSVGAGPFQLAVADFNGDGRQDLAVAELGASDAGVLLGNGDGTFQPEIESPAGLPAASIAAGDLDGDTKPDLVVGSYDPGGSSAQFSTLINAGNFTSTGPQDLSFAAATGGSVDLPFMSEQVLQEPDSQILSVGHQGSISGNTSQGVLEQLNLDGTVDSTFGAGGLVTTPMSSNDAFYSAAVEPNGQIIAVGSSGTTFLVARYDSNGTLDTTFGANGFATADFGVDGAAVASSVAIEPDGSIVVGGQAGTTFAVARFTSAGALDSTFNPGGADDSTFPAGGQRTVSTGSAGTISQILVEGDGSILGVGSAGAGVVVFRLNADGSNDATFGTGGIVTISQLSSQDPSSVAITPGIGLQPGGNILIAGEAPSPGGLAAVQLDASGTLDTTQFGANGLADASFGGANDDINSIQVNPQNGEFVLTGTTNAGGTAQIAIAAFNADGTPNTAALAPNGQLTMSVPSLSGADSLVRAPSAGGSKTPESVRPFAFHPQLVDFAFAGFQSDGKLLVGASGATDSTLRRIQTIAESPTKIADFGKIGRKNVKLAPFTLANGTLVTITMSSGSGSAFHVGNQVQLTLSGSAAVTIRTKGGSNSLSLSSVTETGSLRSFVAPTATLAGILSTTGTIGQLTLGNISGVVISAGGIANLRAGVISGSVSCAGVLATAKVSILSGTIAAAQIRNLTVVNLSHATVLAGTNLGSDGQLGGTSSAADNYGAGLIQSLHVTGTIADSFIGAGVNPVDGIFGDGDDTLVGAKSVIKSLTVKVGVDSLTRFETGGFPKIVHIPGKVITAGDPRFVVLTAV